MKTNLYSRALAFAILAIVSTGSFAFSEPSVKVAVKANWIKDIAADETFDIKNIEVNDGSFLELYETQINIAKQADYNHQVLVLKNETGVQNNSQIEVRYDPSYQTLTFHHIRIIRDGKTSEVCNPSKFKIVKQESDLSRFLYNGTYTALFILEDVRVGDKIEYDYTLTGFNPVFNHKYFEQFNFQGSSPVGHLYYSVITPASRTLNYKSFNNAPDAVITKMDGGNSIKYEWSIQNNKGSQSEDHEPGWYDPYPRVQISEMNSWKEVVDWALTINPDFTKLTPALKKTTDQWKSESTSVTDYMQKCVRFVQDEVRYMGIEMDAYGYKPHNPEQIFTQRYGDCKDKSLLLCALLSGYDIDAHPAIISTTKRSHTAELLPSPLAFDHCVCVAYFNNREWWIDPTIPLQRGKMENLYFPMYGKALVIKPGETNLHDIPPSKSGEVRVNEKFIFHDITKDGFLNVTTQYIGVEADQVRSDIQEDGLETSQKNYLDYYSKLYDSIAVEEPLKYEDNADDNILTVHESYRIRHIWQTDKNDSLKYYFEFNPQILSGIIVTVPKNLRKAPVKIKYPYTLDYNIQVVTPEEWTITPEQLELKNSSFKFNYASAKNEKGFTLSYSYQSFKPEVAADEIERYTKDVDKMNGLLGYKITWNYNLTPKKLATNFSLNYSFLIIAFFILVIFGFIATKVWQISILSSPPLRTDTIGGWMVLPLIGLCVTPLILIYAFLSNNYFNEAYMLQLKTSSATSGSHWDVWIIFEIFGNLLKLSLCIFCLVAFVKRRDITPRLMITYFIVNALVNGFDLMIANSFNIDVSESDKKEMYRSVLYVAIWVPFFLKSERVRNTFVVSYHPFKTTPIQGVETTLNPDLVNIAESTPAVQSAETKEAKEDYQDISKLN